MRKRPRRGLKKPRRARSRVTVETVILATHSGSDACAKESRFPSNFHVPNPPASKFCRGIWSLSITCVGDNIGSLGKFALLPVH